MADFDSLADRLKRASEITGGEERRAEAARGMEPNLFETVGAAIADVPVLGSVLGKLGEVGQIGLKTASAIPLALQGDFDKMGERLGQAALGVPQFFGIGGEPEYLDPGQVLTEIGIPEENLGRVDIPVLGTFTGRGLMKFALSVGTDPLVWGAPGIGGVTSAGRAAARAGTMAKAPLVAGRVGSRLAAQALAGQRSLLTFFGKPIIPKALSAKVLGMGEMGVRRLAQGPFKALSRYGGLAEGKAWKSGAQTAGGGLRVEAERAATGLIDEIDEMAKAKGVPVEEIMEQLAAETEAFANNPALRARKARLLSLADRAQARADDLMAKAKSEAPGVLKAQGGTMPMRARKSLEAAQRLRAEAAKPEMQPRMLRESAGLTPEQAAKRGAAQLQPEGAKVRLYHGTPSGFNAFDPTHATPTGLGETGFYFSDNPATANAYTGGGGPRGGGATGPNISFVDVPKARIANLDAVDPQLRNAGNVDAALKSRGYAGTYNPATGEYVIYEPNRFKTAASLLGDRTRGDVLRMADEYRSQGWDDRTASRAAVQRARNPDLDPEMAPLAAMYDRILRPLVREERRRGVATSVLSDPFLNWVKRSLTPEAAAKIAENDAVGALLGSTWRKKFGARNASASRRKAAYEGMKIPEMEAKFREFYPDFKGRFWEIDPLALIRKRARQTEGSVTKAEMFRRAVEDFARPVTPEAIAQGYVPLTDVLADSGHVLHEGLLSRLGLEVDRVTPRGSTLPTSLAGAKGMALPKEVAQSLVRMSELMSNPAVPGSLMRTLQAATDSFKWLTTRIFPAFYVRNYVSDLWRNFEADIPLTAYWKAAKAMKNPDGLIDLGNGATMPARQAIDTLDASGVKFGVMRESVGAAKEVPTGFLTRAEKRIRGAAGTAEQKLHTAVGENHTRMAHFIGRLMKGDSIDDAILSVKKYLFDYRDLSPVERSVFRTVMPFYCVPEDSEILTRRGWATCDGLQDGEEVLTYNNEHDCLEWQKHTGKYVYDYDQPLMVFESKRRNLRFTHDHRWPVRIAEATVERPYGTYHYDAKHEIRMGHQLGTNCSFICAAKLQSDKSVLTPGQARLVGWIVTDGYHRWRGNHCEAVIYQSPGKFLGEIIEVAGGTPRKPHPTTGVICVPVLNERIKEVSAFLDKPQLPSVVARLSTEAAEAMYDAMYKAEGSVSPTRRGDHFAQNPGPVLEAFRLLATMLGKTTSADYSRGCYVSDRRYLKIASGRLTEEHYVGRVWCPTTPNGTWLMKQGGTIVISGNSWQRHNLPLMLEHLATKPGKLAVANHAFEALSDGDAPGSVSTSYIPEWIKRRLFFTVKGDENEETVVSGFGLPFEDLSLLDGKPEDFLSMLNPVAKVPLELATGKDFFTGRDIADNERANPLLRHLESVPGGKAFLDWLSFRPTGREGEYRADPTKLKLFELPPLAGASRFGRTAEQIAQDPTAGLGRFVTGIRQQTFTPQQQAVQNLRRAMEFATAKLEKLRAEGVVYEQNERFSVRREMLPTDPRVLEARKAQRDIGILSKMIRAQNAAMPAAGMGTAIRSGGR